MEDGSLKKIGKQADKTAASTENLTKSNDKYKKKQKGVAGATSNSTKAFSKMSTGIEGTLVPAYATLAANVFAITAAFGALKRASAASQLEEGLLFTGRAAGANLKMISDGLRDITGTAISAADAMSAVAIGTSAGFNQEQLEGLASVAKGASLALGRDMTDAMDRLIRGAAKLEPEILDELGIMVRLDKATKDFADTLGKVPGQLTMFERRMAFTNAIIEQGSNKFLALSEHMKSNPFDRLAATFDNISKGGINILNTVFGPLAGFFADNMPVMIGAMVLFGTGVAKQMIPALTNQAQAASEAAEAQSILAKQEVRGLAKTKGRTKAAKALIQAIERGDQTTDQYVAALKAEETQLKRNGTLLKNKKIDQAQYNQRKADGAAETKRYTDALATEEAARKSGTQVEALSLIQGGEMRKGLKLGLAGINDEAIAMQESRQQVKGLDRAKRKLGDSIALTTKRMRLFGAAALRMIPIIGQLIAGFGILKAAYDKFFGQPPSFLDKALEDNKERMEEFPAVFNQLVSTFDLVTRANDQFIAGLRVTVGQLAQIKQGVTDIRTAEEADALTALAKAQLAEKNLTGALAKKQGALNAPQGALELNLSARDGGAGGGYMADRKAAIKVLEKQLADAKIATASAQKLFDTSSGTAVQASKLLVQEGIIQSERIASLAAAKGNTELKSLADKNTADLRAALDTFEKGLLADGTAPVSVMKALEGAIQAAGVQGASLQHALDGASDAISVISTESTKISKTKGRFAADIDGIQTIIDLTEGLDFGAPALNEKYNQAFELYKIEATMTKENAALVKDSTGKAIGADKVLFENKRAQLIALQGTMATIANDERLSALLDQEAVSLAAKRVAMGDEEGAHAAIMQRMKNKLIALELALTTQKQIGRDAVKDELEVLKQIEAENPKNTAHYNKRSQEASASGMGAAATASLAGQADVTNAKAERERALAKANGNENDASVVAADGAIAAASMQQARSTLKGVTEDLAAMGPEGATMSAAIGGIQNFATSFGSAMETMGDSSASTSAKIQAGLGAASSLISGMAAMQKAATADKIRGIDQEIAAEKARDGKSAGSVAKLEALEKKKTAAAKKGFEQEKKMKMAQTIISTAQGAIAAYTSLASIPIVGPALGAAAAAMVISMGAKQLAMISATSFQGGGSIGGADATPSKISIGQRNNTVDLAKSNSASGELAYMRGADGVGGAGNFRPAFSGYKHRAGGGYVVGEQGPELFMPNTPGEIIPSGQNVGGSTNVSFNINTVDATGVEELLIGQKGNIIGMIRDAANSYGESFMDGVDTTVYNKTTEGVSRY
jgi:hypothetical protein